MRIVDGLSVMDVWHNVVTQFGLLVHSLDWQDPINYVVAISLIIWTASIFAVLGNWLLDVWGVLTCIDGDIHLKGHRTQHVDIVLWAILAELVVALWLLTHHEASGAGWAHTWEVHLVGEYLVFAILARGIHNLKVARHLHKELGGKGW